MTLIVSGQEFQVRSFRLAANDISAVKYQRLDLNGNPCALIKVGLGVQGAKFPGTEVVGDVKFDTGEYWVYVVDGGHGDRYTDPQRSNEDKYNKYNEQNNNFSNISAISNDGFWAKNVGGVV